MRVEPKFAAVRYRFRRQRRERAEQFLRLVRIMQRFEEVKAARMVPTMEARKR